MNWTKEQQEAIELRGKNILVSAAAGSGKTAVLVERIKRLILDEGCSIDRMLIVTFTNAAAAEMKEKIRKALGAAAESENSDINTLAFLKKQINLLSTANISTFHSFAIEVIRRYFYLIGVEPNFQICDSTQSTLLREEAMDQLLEELFEEGSPQFYHFLKCYSGDRNENRFRAAIDKCYDTIMSLPEPFVWLRESVEQLKDGTKLTSGPMAESLFTAAEESLEEAKELFLSNLQIAEKNNLAGLAELCEKDLEIVKKLCEAAEARDYEAFRQELREVKFPKLMSKIFEGNEELQASAKKNRESAKKAITNIKDEYFTGSFEELQKEMAMTYEPALYMETLLKRYDELYKLKKDEKNSVDFGDLEHYAYEILKDEEAAGFYRDRFEHIFIDEYQDSNVIQEALIDLIKRENNLFMVGDVKQSIYKFRLAEPEIFQAKYRKYSDGRDVNSTKIDLNKNFRSKTPIINFINEIFQEVMAGYDENAQLYVGDVNGDKEKQKPALMLAQVPWEEDADIDDELKNIIKAEKEALAAAAIIRDHLGKTIFDSKNGVERPLQKRDIVILMRSVKNYADVFYKVLTENNLPAYIDDNDGFFDTMEIETFLSALYVIDNPKQDIQLMTLLRSEMLGFSIEEMVEIRIACKTGSYYDAFVSYSGGDNDLAAKCREALDKIENWRELSQIMPLDKLIWKLLLDTGFYIAMGAMPAGSQRQANLRALTDKALAYSSGSSRSLYGFIRYIEAIKDKKVSMGQVKMMSEKDDLVRIMTVHKSKGLEFPMVLLAGYCRKLMYDSIGKSPVFHKDLGIGFPLVDPDNHWYKKTLLQKMIKDRCHREEADEQKRVLYVALTRAMDKLILLGICGDTEKELEKIRGSAASNADYFAMTGKVIDKYGGVRVMDDSSLLNLSKGKKRNINKILQAMDDCGNLEITPQIERLMTFEYPYKEDMSVHTKYSVSDLNSHGRRAIENLGEPQFISGEKSLGAMGRGTVYHSVLEHMDIAKAYREGENYITSLIEEMVVKEMLTEKEAEILDIQRLANFASSNLAERIAASPKVSKEKRFNFMTEYKGNNIIVRGIIDCFFEEDGEIVLLDYKTGNSTISEEAVKERYEIQMNLYKEALEAATEKKVKEIYLYLTDSGKIIKM